MAVMEKPYKMMLITIILLTLAPLGISLSQQKPEEQGSFTDACKHCHGQKLEGVKKIKKKCGQCHDLKPLSVENIKSTAIKETVMQEPHIHRARNMFSNTPSCYLCHRKNEF
jgi:hypothetical protein